MSFLVEHLLLTVVALPALGGLLVALVPRPAVRWVGLGFAVSGVLSGVLVVALPRLGLALSSPVLAVNVGGVDLSLQLGGGLVGAGLCLVPATAALSAVLLGWQHRPARRRDATTALLLSSAAMLVLLGASPVIVLAGLLLTSACFVVVMKSSRDDSAAALLSASHAVSSAVLLLVVAATLSGGETLSASTMASLVVLGSLLRFGFPPIHGASAACGGASSAASRLLVVMVGATTSGVALLRLMPQSSPLPSGWALVGAAGMVFGAFVAMGAQSVRHVAVGFHVALVSLVLCGVALGDESATVAGVLTLSVAPTAVLVLGRAIERRVGSDAFTSLGGLSQSMPAALLLMIASTGVAALLPATSGFVSLLLVLVRGVGWDRGGGWTVVLLVAVGFVLLTAASTRVVRRTFFGPPEPGSVSPSELRWWESLAVVLVILLAVVGGIVPGTFL
jgi:NADH:ubiquinone oxidoreductase subunit 4 (subunit M)